VGNMLNYLTVERVGEKEYQASELRLSGGSASLSGGSRSCPSSSYLAFLVAKLTERGLFTYNIYVGVVKKNMV
jgi:hypothetical protein